MEDRRGNLFYNLVDILKVKTPKYFLFENVKGLLTHNRGNTFKIVKQSLRNIGYDISYSVLNARNFRCPQNRERLFMFGSSVISDKSFIFPDIHAPEVKVIDAIGDLLTNNNIPNNEPMKHTKRILERYKYIPQGGSLRDVPPEHQQRRRGNVLS